jgi:plastocyanin
MRRCLLLVAALPATLAGCGDDDNVVEGLPTVEGAPEVVVVGSDFAFEPPVLHLRAGEPVNIVFEVSEGGHDLVVALPDDETFRLPIIDEGRSTSGGLTIDEPGSYQLFCSVPGHAQEGMVGTVEVEE